MKKPLTALDAITDDIYRAAIALMGSKGGLARAKALTKAQRLASSRKANKAKAKKQRHEGLSSKQFILLG